MENQNKNRRSFLKKAALGGLMAVSIPEILAASAVSKTKKITLLKDNIFLFQGDSITDAGRNREDHSFNNSDSLGSGYPSLAGAQLMAQAWITAVR